MQVFHIATTNDNKTYNRGDDKIKKMFSIPRFIGISEYCKNNSFRNLSDLNKGSAHWFHLQVVCKTNISLVFSVHSNISYAQKYNTREQHLRGFMNGCAKNLSLAKATGFTWQNLTNYPFLFRVD